MASDTTKQTSDSPPATAAGGSQQSLSTDQRRTLTYVVAAVVCLGITGIIEWSSRPAPIEEYGKVGQPFYADFEDPTLAASLEVYVFDAEKVMPLDFRVRKLENGRWVIPSHHDYPADAEDQLAKTAASIIGITRGAMVTRWEADHAQFGVVNPKTDRLNVADVEGIGKRIILRGDDDLVLADYIIGDQVDSETGQYYVRHPEEEEVYIATLDIDLSTKFSDWINTDLLGVNAFDMREVVINDYSFDELQGRVSSQEVSTFTRETSSDPWTLAGLDDESQEVDSDAMRETVNAIADLTVAGVRPKQKGLTPDLKLDREALTSQQDLDRLQSDLLTRGFLLQQAEGGDRDNLRLIAREGELNASTEDGLVYRLHFGRAFTGSQEELEIGLNSPGEGGQKNEDAAGDASAEEPQGDAPSDSGDAAEGDDEQPSESTSNKPGRYVFVRVEFDKRLLGPEPEAPVEPTKPAELQAAEDASENGESPEESAASAQEPDAANEAEEDPLAEIRTQYEDAKLQYENDLREFQRQQDELNTKVAEGTEKAADLNRRFAEWYYVIPGDSFDKVRLSRADLVKAKEEEEPADVSGDADPGISLPDFLNPSAGDQTGAGILPESSAPLSGAPESGAPLSDAPASDTPASDEASSAATPTDTESSGPAPETAPDE